jgi:nitrous oxidase accessory protein NosD
MRIRMSKSVALLLVLVLAASSIVAFLPVHAEARVIVVPDDYLTISEAIRNANDGDSVFVKKGTYEEKTLEIDKPLSIVGEGAEFTKINLDPPLYSSPPDILNRTSSWFGPSITVDVNDFKISGFTINTSVIINKPGGEISIAGNRTQIIGNHIITGLSINGSYWKIAENTFSRGVGMVGSYGNISANKFVGSGGIYVAGVYNIIFSNNIAGRDNTGIHVEGASCVVYGNNVTENSGIGGIYVSSDGTIVARNVVDHSNIGVKVGGSDNIIYANNVTNNGAGLAADSRIYNYWKGAVTESGGSNIFYANYVANNVVGADINPYPENNVTSNLYHNNFIGNTHQVAAVQGYPYGSDSFDNGEEGNYWSDYNGTDADGDGIGDTPYVIDDKRQDRYPLLAPFDIDSVTIELPEWAFPSPNPSLGPQASEPSEPFPTTLVAVASGASAVAVGAILLIYFKKRNR